MKIVFFGSSDFSVPFLNAIYNSNHQLVSVVTGADKAIGRGMSILGNPVKEYASKKEFKIIQADKIDNEIISNISRTKFDCLVVVSYGKLLPSEILKFSAGKSINVHPSLLPKYRGPSPIVSAIFNGDSETGISIISISERLDEGDIFAQCKFSIQNNETKDSLETKMIRIGAPMLISILDLLEEGKIFPYPQGKKGITYTSTFSKEDLKIDWHNTAQQIDNKIRAFSPEPGCFSLWNKKVIKIIKASKIINFKINDNLKNKKSGEIISADKVNGLIVKCGKDEIIKIEILKPQSKKAITALDFLNGYRIKTGDFFE
ncbi:MAG: methionyl-tRNA formyltransferase [Actinobacteria bacterium]|nr:methionyl-tRNA formyltransferase [Actinomycetota bacterium]